MIKENQVNPEGQDVTVKMVNQDNLVKMVLMVNKGRKASRGATENKVNRGNRPLLKRLSSQLLNCKLIKVKALKMVILQ